MLPGKASPFISAAGGHLTLLKKQCCRVCKESVLHLNAQLGLGRLDNLGSGGVMNITIFMGFEKTWYPELNYYEPVVITYPHSLTPTTQHNHIHSNNFSSSLFLGRCLFSLLSEAAFKYIEQFKIFFLKHRWKSFRQMQAVSDASK